MSTINKEKTVKKLRCIQRSAGSHWVGNGFPVRTLFAYPNLGPVLSPFLLLDYAGPMEFPPTNERLGVGEHPTPRIRDSDHRLLGVKSNIAIPQAAVAASDPRRRAMDDRGIRPCT